MKNNRLQGLFPPMKLQSGAGLDLNKIHFRNKYGREPSGTKDFMVLEDMKRNPSKYGITPGVLPQANITAQEDFSPNIRAAKGYEPREPEHSTSYEIADAFLKFIDPSTKQTYPGGFAEWQRRNPGKSSKGYKGGGINQSDVDLAIVGSLLGPATGLGKIAMNKLPSATSTLGRAGIGALKAGVDLVDPTDLNIGLKEAAELAVTFKNALKNYEIKRIKGVAAMGLPFSINKKKALVPDLNINSNAKLDMRDLIENKPEIGDNEKMFKDYLEKAKQSGIEVDRDSPEYKRILKNLPKSREYYAMTDVENLVRKNVKPVEKRGSIGFGYYSPDYYPKKFRVISDYYKSGKGQNPITPPSKYRTKADLTTDYNPSNPFDVAHVRGELSRGSVWDKNAYSFSEANFQNLFDRLSKEAVARAKFKYNPEKMLNRLETFEMDSAVNPNSRKVANTDKLVNLYESSAQRELPIKSGGIPKEPFHSVKEEISRIDETLDTFLEEGRKLKSKMEGRSPDSLEFMDSKHELDNLRDDFKALQKRRGDLTAQDFELKRELEIAYKEIQEGKGGKDFFGRPKYNTNDQKSIEQYVRDKKKDAKSEYHRFEYSSDKITDEEMADALWLSKSNAFLPINYETNLFNPTDTPISTSTPTYFHTDPSYFNESNAKGFPHFIDKDQNIRFLKIHPKSINRRVLGEWDYTNPNPHYSKLLPTSLGLGLGYSASQLNNKKDDTK